MTDRLKKIQGAILVFLKKARLAVPAFLQKYQGLMSALLLSITLVICSLLLCSAIREGAQHLGSEIDSGLYQIISNFSFLFPAQ
jgi:hypothetical protein